MAGIFVEIDSDIKKLQRLKAEIESVKKALTKINVNVEIDMAKGMEAQLKSLMGQYDGLIKKIAEAEGKILLSTKKINDASEKIISAQERISKVSGLKPQEDGDVGGNSAQIASIDAQAKAYNELKIEIESIIGTRSQNIKRMVEEQNAIRLINAEIKQITKTQGQSAVLSKSQQQRLEQLNNSLLTHKTALAEVRQNLSNNAKLDNVAATSMNGLSQSLQRMRITYRELTEEERNSPFGKELLSSIQQADTKIKQLDATIGNHQRNVGNYASGWNGGLSMSIQQIGRELPSLAVGWNTFFLAISNNLPILVDEIKRAKVQYNELKDSGQKAVPVWKQVVSSIFSWQTALTVGITLLTLYGDKVVDWVAGLFKAKKALSETYQATEEFQKSVSQSSGKVLATIEKLSKAWMKLGDDVKSKEKFILDYKSELDSTGIAINNVADAENLLSKNKDAFINAIIDKAKATAIMELASKEYEKYIQKMLEADAKAEEGVSLGDRFKSWMARSAAGEDLSGTLQKADLSPEAYAKEKEAKLRKDAENYRTSMLDLIKKALKIEEKSNKEIEKAGGESKDILVANSIETIEAAISAKREELRKATNRRDYLKIKAEIEAEQTKLYAITGNTKQENQAKKEAAKQLKQQEQLAEQLLSIRRKNQQDEINLMEDGTEKKLAQIDLDYQKELDAIKKQRKEWEDAQGGKLTEEQSLVIDLRKELAGKKKDSDTSKVHEEEVKEYQKLLSSYQDYLTKRKNTEDKFNADRKKLKDGGASDAQINELEYQRDETLRSIDNEFAMREDSFKAWTDNIANLSLEKLRELLVQAERELERSEFLNPNEPKLAGQRAKVTSLKNIINEKASKTDTSPGKRSQKEWQDLYKTLSKVEKEFDEIGKTVGGTAGEIISAAGSIASSTLQMIDGITTLANSSSDAMAGTAQAASKSIQAVEKASVILAIVGAALQITTKMFELFGGDTTTEKYEEAKEAYQSYIDILDKVIDKQLELAESLSGDNAQAAYDRAIELVKTQSEAARVLGKQYLNSGSSWKSHSKGYKEVDDMSAAGWADAAKALGMSVSQFKSAMGGRMTGLFDLTDEQLAKLQEEAHIFWAQLDSDTQNYANQIAEGVAQVKEVLEQQMTDTTLIDVDTLRNDFHDLLTDMDADSADFADNFEDYMRNAILNSMLKESYMGRLEEWRKKFYAAMDDGVTEQEYNALKEEGQQIADEMKAQRDAMADMFGWESESTSQSSTSKGFQSMSQDTGEELNGRFTALQIAGEEIKNQNIAQSQSLSILNTRIDTISSTSSNIRDIASETRDIIASSYLELVQISENTGAIVKPVQQMQKDIAEVKKNTSKL